MAERKYRSSEKPNLETFPSSPIDRTGLERPSLEQRAAELGAAAGQIAATIRQTRERVEKLARGPVRDRVSSLADDVKARAEDLKARAEHLRRVAGNRAQEWTRAAQAKSTELGRQAREKTADLARQAKSGYFRSRDQAKETVHKYPVHTALAAGAVGFLLGVALRMRRTKRAY
jgi:ElaB/YqjD/DUF883 family membrane-anchored ribosome-binding protein